MTRSTLFNYVLALLGGIALGAAGAVHVITVRVEARTRAATAANAERIRRIDDGWRSAMVASCPPPETVH